MASLWLPLSVILCIITEMVAIPLRIAPQEEEYASFGKKLEESLLRQRMRRTRFRRENSDLPLGCDQPDSVFGLGKVPHCHVTRAEYDAEKKLCLEQLIHVPGMPDGKKGGNYVVYNHYLYKAYNATERLGIVPCPTATTQLQNTTEPTTELTNGVKPSTSANAPSVHATGLASTTPVTGLASSVPAKSLTTKPNSSSNNVVPVTTGAPTVSSKIPSTQTTPSGGPNVIPTA